MRRAGLLHFIGGFGDTASDWSVPAAKFYLQPFPTANLPRCFADVTLTTNGYKAIGLWVAFDDAFANLQVTKEVNAH